jgi:sulfite dehydrogenase (cytochrome) subunit A
MRRSDFVMGSAAMGLLSLNATGALAPGDGHASLVREWQSSFGHLSQKRPLILLTSRPPQLETPMSVFDEGYVQAKVLVRRKERSLQTLHGSAYRLLTA